MLQDPDLDDAIEDLERQLDAARERVKRLELILEICRDRLERGAPLSPGGPEQEDFGPETR